MKQHRFYNFIAITQNEFQRYQSEPITEQQALEIQHNLFGVVGLLMKWSRNANDNKCA